MRVPADHLVGDLPDDVDDVEAVLVAGDLGVEDHLQQDVAELLLDGGIVVGVDRFEEFVSLFERVRLDGRHRLLAVPRAAVGRAKSGDHFTKPGKRLADGLGIGRGSLGPVGGVVVLAGIHGGDRHCCSCGSGPVRHAERNESTERSTPLRGLAEVRRGVR